MLDTLFPNTHQRFTSLPLLGAHVDGFVQWLAQHDYRPQSIRVMLGYLGPIEQWLLQHGLQDLTRLDPRLVEACWAQLTYRTGRRNAAVGGVLHALVRYLEAAGVLPPAPPVPLTPSGHLLAAYTTYLRHVRGLAPHTIQEHHRSAAQFLAYLAYDTQPARLTSLTASEVEAFVCHRGARLGRGTQQHYIAHLRSFLRFAATTGHCPAGLDRRIDTPRLYRREQLPRALPWDTVQALLQSIDRTTPIGLRDYTILLLLATYGLRVSEVAALTLDDLHWRAGWFQVPRCKTRSALHLPLTAPVEAALVHYLQVARPNAVSCRALFLRHHTPLRALAPTAVSMIFHRWAQRSGLAIPFAGAHCLRHAYAVHLLRTGHALKTIGDLLGHRDSDSTYGYLRLATEELRDVALPLPTLSPACPPEKGASS
jgi:integrase/recombinase XerD